MAFENGHTDNPAGAADESSAPDVLERLVRQAELAQASDIHLHLRGDNASVAFRLDGVMTSVAQIPAPLAERVLGRVKFLARLKTYQDSLPQDGRIQKEALNSSSDLRVSTYPTVTGEKIVLRLFHPGAAKTLPQLGFPADALQELEQFLGRTSGLLLVTGPAGSGKTTTIYACLHHLALPASRSIITVEDPVEQIIDGVTQTEVSEPRGLDFAKAARHLLRQDPEVLVIGEIRDEETAAIAVRAAFTGHLVISTLHAGSCRGVFDRFMDLCPDHSAIAACLHLVVNQRLLRKVCSSCSGKGCPDCLATGYRGRVPLVEFLRVTPGQKDLIRARQLDSLTARPSLADRARDLVAAGLTTSAEMARVLGTGTGTGADVDR